MDCLILRLDAPLMSFGSVRVDQHNPTARFPGRSQLTGLLANALGWSHGDMHALNHLQSRIVFAARWDVTPKSLRDYQTADLGQPHLRDPGWTTRGNPEHRHGGLVAKFGTHQRFRDYWADGVMTLALTLTNDGKPDLGGLESALRYPERPLFIGRKPCLPASRLLQGRREAVDLRSALAAEPADPRAGEVPRPLEACWPPTEEDDLRQRVSQTDDRDWPTQTHVGQRLMVQGLLNEVPPCS